MYVVWCHMMNIQAKWHNWHQQWGSLLDISGTLKFCRTLQAHYMTTSSKNMRQQELLQTASQSFFCSFKQQPLQPPHALQVMKSSVVITRTMLFGLLATVSHCFEKWTNWLWSCHANVASGQIDHPFQGEGIETTWNNMLIWGTKSKLE